MSVVEAPSAAQATWPELTEDHPLSQLNSRLPNILSEAGHSQIWGVTLTYSTPPAFSTLIILQKFLRSVDNSVDEAATALGKTLKWRKDWGLDVPADQKEKGNFGPDFEGLGYVTKIKKNDGGDEIVTWNVYGAVKDLKSTFGDLDR